MTNKANAFMDDLVKELKTDKSQVYSLDPLSVPDVKETNFETKDLTVNGLSSLHRYGNCSVTLTKNMTEGSIGCHLSAKNLNVNFNYWAKALFFWFSGKYKLKVLPKIILVEF